MADSSSRHPGGWVVGGVIVIICAAAFYFYSKPSRENPLSHLPSVPALSNFAKSILPGLAPAPSSTPTPAPAPTLAELSAADLPPTVTLLKPEQIRFKKGGIFVANAGTPLFFVKDYLRDAKPGEEFQILDYDPANRHVFLRAHDPDGRILAVNTLDLHGSSKQVETLPPNTVVTLQGVADGNALVAYQGERFAVPADDTDLLDQVAARKAQQQAPGGN